MNWFLIVLTATFLWGFVNIADNYLVANFSHKDRERSSGGLVLFSSLIGIFIAIFIYIFIPDVFNIPLLDKFLLFITGIFTIIWIILYLFTLEIEEVSNVVPWFLTIPIFGYILGRIFLNENLTPPQMVGSIIILIGVSLLSINWTDKGQKFKTKIAIYMSLSSFFIALSGVIFKYVTVEGNFWISSFWEYLGLGITGIVIYLFIPKYRNEFHFMNKKGGLKIFVLNTISEVLTIFGNLLSNFALLLAPVSMVYLVGSFQPAIVLALTILGTIFLPKIIKENISFDSLFPKIIAILIMILGSILLFI